MSAPSCAEIFGTCLLFAPDSAAPPHGEEPLQPKEQQRSLAKLQAGGFGCHHHHCGSLGRLKD
jgi:hypothetical protein